MKSIIKFTVVTVLSLFTFNSAWAAQNIAQCLVTQNKLQVSGIVKTGRGTEFFVWFINNYNLNYVLGNYQGTEVMNLMDQVTVQSKFQMSITRSEVEGEVNIAITGSDLSPLSQKKDHAYNCKIIAY